MPPLKSSLPQLQQQRDEILHQIQAIDRLRRGTLSEQFFTRQAQGQTVRQGPYYVLQCFLQGTKCSERIASDQAAQTKIDVAHYQRFQELAKQFIEVTDQLTRLADGSTPAKKNSRRRRSPRNSSGKPKRS